jgi:hypothetical protein
MLLLFQRGDAPGFLAEGADGQFAQVVWQVSGLDAMACGERNAALDDVSARARCREVVGAQQVEGIRRQFDDALPISAACFARSSE